MDNWTNNKLGRWYIPRADLGGSYMPIYSEVLHDDEILRIVSDKHNYVLLLGCGGCMNESLAFYHRQPLTILDDNGLPIPYAVKEELERISSMLNRNGIKTEYRFIPEGTNSRCMIDCTKGVFNAANDIHPSMIMAVCCPAGVRGLRLTYDNIPIIKVTKQRGFLFYVYMTKNDGTREIVIDESEVCYSGGSI
jgi:hypothetical protein